MQLVTVLYPAKDGAKFNFEYYMKKHIPWVSELVGKPIDVRRGLSSATGAPAPFICVATIHINSLDEFQAIFAKHGAEIMGDIPNYTNIEPVVQFDEVLA
jgi:uncharacterized protein (TIGR02118 family)